MVIFISLVIEIVICHSRKGKAVPLTEEHTLENEDERRRILDMGVELFPDQTRLCGIHCTCLL